MDKERKKQFHDGLLDLRMQQQIYFSEHKEENPEISLEISNLKRAYALEILKEKGIEVKGDGKHVKH